MKSREIFKYSKRYQKIIGESLDIYPKELNDYLHIDA